MRQLIRPADPAALRKYDYLVHNWDQQAPTTADRDALWNGLLEMQGDRCAYCEATLGSTRHIEHFRSRSRFKNLTFSWSNLFGSCNELDSCGIYKDQKGRPYDPADLIKPDEEPPHIALRFFTDGRVEPRADLPHGLARKAAETIRVFNLDEGGTLRARRREAIRPFRIFLGELDSMRDEISEAETIELIETEIEHAAGAAHEGAIRQALIG